MHCQGQEQDVLRIRREGRHRCTLKHNLIVGARAFTGNPFDGYTLSTQLEQATVLMQDTGMKPPMAHVDLGYRGIRGTRAVG